MLEYVLFIVQNVEASFLQRKSSIQLKIVDQIQSNLLMLRNYIEEMWREISHIHRCELATWHLFHHSRAFEATWELWKRILSSQKEGFCSMSQKFSYEMWGMRRNAWAPDLSPHPCKSPLKMTAAAVTTVKPQRTRALKKKKSITSAWWTLLLKSSALSASQHHFLWHYHTKMSNKRPITLGVTGKQKLAGERQKTWIKQKVLLEKTKSFIQLSNLK